MGARVWPRRIATFCVMVMILGRLSSATADPRRVSMCPRQSVVDLIVELLDRSHVGDGTVEGPDFVGVTEVGEIYFFYFCLKFFPFMGFILSCS